MTPAHTVWTLRSGTGDIGAGIKEHLPTAQRRAQGGPGPGSGAGAQCQSGQGLYWWHQGAAVPAAAGPDGAGDGVIRLWWAHFPLLLPNVQPALTL